MNKDLRKEIEDLDKILSEKKDLRSQIERTCPHKWSEVKRNGIHRPSYTIPGDPPGTMGVDHRGPLFVPETTIYRWERTCLLCGKIEFTSKSKQEIKEVKDIPVF